MKMHSFSVGSMHYEQIASILSSEQVISSTVAAEHN